MKIYEVYKDFSDEYNQDYESFGHFLNKDKAVEKFGLVLKERESLSDEEIKDAKRDCSYDVYYVGFYGVKEIDVIE
ncbi:hypothetical protein KFD70_21945 [Bacillus pfraonensis]|uniref:hypothetical protein n=1 Tax=Bacillus TaxID=1386 RepID=UPI001F51D59D|nr:hypothetical protein [Bacillus sp. TL12]MCI0767439.1 hypothetical protein [Bacillus sp. TL12]